MKIQMAMTTIGVLALAGQSPCAKPEAHTAKDDLKGRIVFSEGSFDDAKKFATGKEFEEKSKTVSSITPAAPQAHLAYYSAFSEPLGANEYILQVFDRSDSNPAPVHVERREGKPDSKQVTAGWGFDIPVWPAPQDPEKLVQNDVWIKPGHHYEVVIMKPLAKGEFSVGGEMAAAAPAATPAPKAPAKEPVEHTAPPVKKGVAKKK